MAKRASKEDREALKFIREHMLDSSKMRQAISAFVQKSIEERREEAKAGGDEANEPMFRIIEHWLQLCSDTAADIIDVNARSPIEKLFFNAFLLGLIKYDGMGFQFHGVFENAPEALEKFTTYYEEIRESYELYRRETGDVDGKNFPKVVDQFVEDGQFTEAQAKDLTTGVVFMYQMNMWNAMHFTLQPRFPGFGLRGRALTADLLMWIPGKPDVKVIVECDGFMYHSDREAFASDRRRDRTFQQRGYRVLRFPGTEIHADPVAMSAELFDALHAIAGPRQYHPLAFGAE